MCRCMLLGFVSVVIALTSIPIVIAGDGGVQERPDLDALCRKVSNIEYLDGRDITNCKLKEPTEFQGRWCDVGDTRFDKDWNLVACHLAEDFTAGELTLPAGSWTQFRIGESETPVSKSRPETRVKMGRE